MEIVEVELDELCEAQVKLKEIANKLTKLRLLTMFNMSERESEMLIDTFLALDDVLQNYVDCWLEGYEAEAAHDRLRLAKWIAWASGEGVAETTMTEKASKEPTPTDDDELGDIPSVLRIFLS